MDTHTRSFTFRIDNLEEARAALDENKPTATVKFVVSVFDKPDTFKPMGLASRQVIDKGAFREWIAGSNFDDNPRPHFVDHGGAGETGVVSDRLKIGKDTAFRETGEGLEVTSIYNLRVQEGRDALERLVFDPANAQFSFSNRPDEVTYRGDDGFEHVRQFPTGVMETSQVGFGAQQDVRLVSIARSGMVGRALSLDELPDKLREGYARAHADTFAVVLESWADDEQRSTGFVIAYRDGGYFMVPWAIGDKGELTFDDEGASEVEQTWVRKGKKTSVRAALEYAMPRLRDVLSDDPELRERLRSAIEHPTSASPSDDLYAKWARSMLAVAPDSA